MNARSCGGLDVAAPVVLAPSSDGLAQSFTSIGPRGAVGEGEAQVVGVELRATSRGRRPGVFRAGSASSSVSASPGLVMKTRSGRLTWSSPVVARRSTRVRLVPPSCRQRSSSQR